MGFNRRAFDLSIWAALRFHWAECLSDSVGSGQIRWDSDGIRLSEISGIRSDPLPTQSDRFPTMRILTQTGLNSDRIRSFPTVGTFDLGIHKTMIINNLKILCALVSFCKYHILLHETVCYSRKSKNLHVNALSVEHMFSYACFWRVYAQVFFNLL
jgi:hypothetical protein